MNVPVLVQVSGWTVSICVLARTPDGVALMAKNTYRPMGHVKRSARRGDHGFAITVWEWTDERGARGIGKTKADAIAKMLHHGGYVEVDINATIPDLLAGLE